MVEAVAGWLVTAGFSSAAATAIAQIGASVLLSAASMAMAKRPSMGDQARELEITRSLPTYRTAYGEARIVGSWAPGWVVNDGILYACIILNSRPSHSVSAIEFDNRVVEFAGDLLDFSTGGTATADPFSDHVTAWLGLGDQTAPPDLIMAEWGDSGSTNQNKFWPTDAWAGRTVLWLRLEKGGGKSSGERWPQGRPQVHVTGKWSLVWNPADVVQDADDPATWEWSDNHGLCMLDALRTNPIAKLPAGLIHLASFERQVQVADELVLRKGGAESDPRYRVGGVIAWNPQSELYQLLRPLEVAGGGALVQIGGMIGYQPGEYLAPSANITDVLDEAPVSFTALLRGRDMPRAIRAIYPEPGAAWEDTTLTPIEVPGGGGWDGGDDRVEDFELSLVPYARQANRLAQIEARLRGQQKKIGGILFPRHLDLVAGANVTMALPRVTDPRNGVYRISRIHPAHFLESGEGVAFRLPFEAGGIGPEVYAWDPETDEQDYAVAVSIDASLALSPPGSIITTSGADLTIETWKGYLARVLFEFDPSPSFGLTGYEWQWREAGGDWTDGGVIDADVRNGDDRAFGYMTNVSDAKTYELRVRAFTSGRISDWVTETGIIVTTGIPRLVADWEDAIYQIDRATVPQATVFGLTRAGAGAYIDAAGLIQTAAADAARIDYGLGSPALLIEPAATNILLYSQDLTQAAWTRSNTNTPTTAGVSAPNGGVAQVLPEASNTATHAIRQDFTISAGQVHTVYAIAKLNGGSTRYLGLSLASAASATNYVTARFDLSGGSVVLEAANGTGFVLDHTEVIALAGGFYLCALTGTIGTATDLRARLYLAASPTTISGGSAGMQSYLGDGTSLIFGGAQVEAGARASSYIVTGAAPVTRAADVPQLRGITAPLDLTVTYGDGATADLPDQSVYPGYWPPGLSQTRIRRIVGTP